jgi:hypothetical protein
MLGLILAKGEGRLVSRRRKEMESRSFLSSDMVGDKERV